MRGSYANVASGKVLDPRYAKALWQLDISYNKHSRHTKHYHFHSAWSQI